jgi:hypothetical protein
MPDMDVPDDLYAAIGIERGLGADEIFGLLSGVPAPDWSPAMSEEGRRAIADRLSAGRCRTIARLSPSHPSTIWRYGTIACDGQLIGEYLVCPASGIDYSDLPPTSSEDLIIDAWASGVVSHPFHDNLTDIVLFRWIDHNIDQSVIDVLLTSMKMRPAPSHMPIVEHMSGKEHLSVTSDAKISKGGVYPRLLQEALNESSPRWRILQLYRIFERGYLDHILEDLNKKFLLSPSSAISDAGEAIGSEYNQLVQLIEGENLNSHFEEIVRIWKYLKTNNNKFAYAIERSLDKRRRNESNLARKGADILYAVRCAIAHAGSASIFYEQFLDAEAFVIRILPEVEAAVFSFMGIQAGNQCFAEPVTTASAEGAE